MYYLQKVQLQLQCYIKCSHLLKNIFLENDTYLIINFFFNLSTQFN